MGAPFAASAGQPQPINVEVIVGFSCVSGTGPPRREVIATLQTPQERVRDRLRARTDKFGFWSGCFSLFGPSTNINGGDRLLVEIGTRVRTVRIPRIEPQVDRVQDVIEGRARAHAQVDIAVTHHPDFKTSRDFFFTARANAAGYYRIDTTGTVDLIGWDDVQILVERKGDLFSSIGLVPGMIVAANSNDVSGSVNNGTDVVLRLRDRYGHLKGDATSGPVAFGSFEVSMFYDDGRALYPRSRDRLAASFASDAVMKIPSSLLRGSATEDVVSGNCPPNAPYELIAGRRSFFGTADATGAFSRDVGNRMNLKRGDLLTLYCLFPSGDVWEDIDIAL
jgi:hypothetical protein